MKDKFEFVDDCEEYRQKCLSCEQEECTNCFANNTSGEPSWVLDEFSDSIKRMMIEEKLSDRQIAEKFNVSKDTVRNFRLRFNIPSAAALKRPKYEEVKRLYESGLTWREINEHFPQVTLQTCRNIYFRGGEA